MRATRKVTLDQAHETKLTLASVGATSEWWTKVAQDHDLARAEVDLAMTWESFKLAPGLYDVPLGWTCAKPVRELIHSPSMPEDFKPELFVPCFTDYSLPGDVRPASLKTLIDRVKPEDRTGMLHAQAMMRDIRKIPILEDFHHVRQVLVFPEIWTSPRDGFYVPALESFEPLAAWHLTFISLAEKCGSYLIVKPHKA